MGIIMDFNTMFLMTFFRHKHFKGQLISKCPFDVIVSTKIPMKFFLRISALASKKRLNQKNKVLINKKIYDWGLFCFDFFLEARAEIPKKFRWYFGRNDETKRTF